MRINTCSGAISFSKELENESAKFYQNVSQKFEKDKDVFLNFVKENGKNIVQIERAYYGVITDAIEGCFAFDISQDEYQFKTIMANNASYSDMLKEALEIEEKILNFYLKAAEQSQYLMADIPRAFKMVAKKRKDRILKLKSFIDAER